MSASPAPSLPWPVSAMRSSRNSKLISGLNLTDLTVPIPNSSQTGAAQPTPSRWRTTEFKIYFAMLACVLPLMMWIPYSLSRPSHPNYGLYDHKLSRGWMFGRDVDNSDIQYRSFRSNVSILSLAILVHWIVRRMLFACIPFSFVNTRNFNLAISLLFVTVLHGTSIIKLLLILGCNYWLAKHFHGTHLAPWITWSFNIAILFANEYFSGYRFGSLLSLLKPLDDYQGIYPRWNINYNITMLRLVSFNLDYYWARNPPSHQPLRTEDITFSDPKQRTGTPHPTVDYSFANYLSYSLYTPLYIAGPILTFNDFLHQVRHPLTLSRASTLRYGVRFLCSLLTMEGILHFMYVVSIKDRKAWEGDTPAEISMVALWNLIIMWLKLLIPWRLFRLWALIDGIDPPENMIRCVANNYSMLSFWRSWHRSYNLWLIRYIYIPLQGSSSPWTQFRNTALIFTFVALWHDLTFRLLAWGWLVSLFVLPEIIGKIVLPQKKYGDEPWYRHICALAGAFNMLLMMMANLVGFVVGVDGLKYYLDRLLGTTQGLGFLTVAIGCLFVGVQLMFEYREEEKRAGIFRRC